jgi:hypothetical protein
VVTTSTGAVWFTDGRPLLVDGRVPPPDGEVLPGGPARRETTRADRTLF